MMDRHDAPGRYAQTGLDEAAHRTRQAGGSMMGYGWADGGGWLWMLGGLLLVIGIIVLVAWVVTRGPDARETPRQGPSSATPNEILRERFARGDITEQEFEQAKKALGPDR
jgi:putative membrane protein